MKNLVVASEAIAAGELTRKRLNRDYERLYRNVYVPNGFEVTARERVYGAWLATGRTAIMAGRSAAFLHGSRWIDADVVPEIISSHTRAPVGITAYRAALRDDETCVRRGVRCTTITRTALDLGCRLAEDDAVAEVDALLNATRTPVSAVAALARRHPHARQIGHLWRVLDLADSGAESKKETAVRLILVRAGLPRPETQYFVVNRRIDMAWPEWKVGVEYDGAHHWKDKFTHGDDVARREFFAERGWRLVHVVSAHLARPDDITARVVKALRAAGWADGAG